MNTLNHWVVLAVAAFALTACQKEPESDAVTPSPQVPARATPAPEVIPSAIVEMAKRAEVERELRQKIETRLAEQEAAKSHWQSGALLSVSAAVILLIVGTCLGTRARHDAKN